MKIEWQTTDLTSSIKSYEYTKKAKYQIYQTVDSKDFEEMDSQTIFDFLADKMELVTFGEYLKRFLYLRYEIDIPIKEVDDSVYQEIIYNSFIENEAPYSFTPTKAKMKTVIKNWLKRGSVKRQAVFILGFGLNMSDKEVEEFLTKVNKEESFDFDDPEETIYWFCYHHHFHYEKAQELLDYKLKGNYEINESLWEAMRHNPKMYIHSENELKTYLSYLKFYQNKEDIVYQEFCKIYHRIKKLIAEIYNEGNWEKKEEKWINEEDINASTIEKILYLEVPKTEKANLEKMSASMLSEQFQLKRLTRQHLSKIEQKKRKPDRYVFITFLFFIYAHDVRPMKPVQRFQAYIDEINDILKRCNMAGIYPVNPYEAFLLMCLVTEDPLETYYDIWKISYGGDV